jgi:Ca-activated chloride channel family protein
VNRNRSWWIWGAAVLLIVFVFAAIVGRLLDSFGGPDQGDGDGGAVATPTTPANAIGISIASSNTKEAWLHQAVDAINAAAASDPELQVDGKPVFVTIIQEEVDGKVADYRSGTMVSDTVAGRIEPTVLSPGEESWVQKFERDWQSAKGADPITEAQSPILVRTPLVVAMWESRAKALGCWPTPGPECTWARLGALASDPQGWGSLGKPEWRQFKFGYGFFGESNSGTLATVAMCMAALGKSEGLTVADVSSDNACGQFLHEIEKAKVHSGKSDLFLLDQMQAGGPEYLDGVVTYESNVIARNRAAGDQLREPLVSVYPQDGTVVVGHPYAILDGAPWVSDEQAAAAGIFRDYLLTRRAACGPRARPPAGDRPARWEAPSGSATGPTRRDAGAAGRPRHPGHRPGRRGLAGRSQARRHRHRLRQVGEHGRERQDQRCRQGRPGVRPQDEPPGRAPLDPLRRRGLPGRPGNQGGHRRGSRGRHRRHHSGRWDGPL